MVDSGRRSWSHHAIACGWVMLLVGCAGRIHVKPSSPTAVVGQTSAGPPVSLFIDPALGHTDVSTKAPSGDVGLGDISVTFELGRALVGTVQGAAQAVFSTVQLVDGRTCAPHTEALLEASSPATPYVQIDWRDESPRVGGGTTAEIVVRVVHRDCAGHEVGRAVAYGYARNENLQFGANWPGEEDFRPGMEQALDDLRLNLTDLFRDIQRAPKEP